MYSVKNKISIIFTISSLTKSNEIKSKKIITYEINLLK